ncbi:MAG: hypothetical protein AB1374_04295 [Bacillota bacterium]
MSIGFYVYKPLLFLNSTLSSTFALSLLLRSSSEKNSRFCPQGAGTRTDIQKIVARKRSRCTFYKEEASLKAQLSTEGRPGDNTDKQAYSVITAKVCIEFAQIRLLKIEREDREIFAGVVHDPALNGLSCPLKDRPSLSLNAQHSIGLFELWRRDLL